MAIDDSTISLIVSILAAFAPLAAALPSLMKSPLDIVNKKKFVSFLLSRKNIKKTLKIDLYDKEEEKYRRTAQKILLMFIGITLFLVYSLGKFQELLGLALVIDTLLVAVSALFLEFVFIFPSFKKKIIEIYKLYRIIALYIIITGITTSVILSYANPLALFVQNLIFYIPLVIDIAIRYKQNDLFEDFIKENIKNLPKIKIFVKGNIIITGKIKELFRKDFLIIKKGNQEMMILWQDIKIVAS